MHEKSVETIRAMHAMILSEMQYCIDVLLGDIPGTFQEPLVNDPIVMTIQVYPEQWPYASWVNEALLLWQVRLFLH